MVRTGRPTIPIEVKRRRGTLRADRTPAALVILPPATADQLGRGSVVEALRTIGGLAWISESDLPMVRLAQQHADDAERLRAALDEQFDKNVFLAYHATQRELRSCLSLLGVSPTDRSRLGVAEVKVRSKIEELMDRRAGRRAS